ncbi:hypothetical protein Tco_0572911 [Tanacetum coccineum]
MRRKFIAKGQDLEVCESLDLQLQYLSALGAAIGKAIEKALQCLQKCATSIVMHKDSLGRKVRFWLESQTQCDAVEVPGDTSSKDQRVIGASALSLSLDVSSSQEMWF